jgi:hypothetical protein
VLVTYPRLVPSTACPALNFTQDGDQVVSSMGAGLEQVFVDVAKTTHVLLADPYVIGQTHGPCAPPDASWIAGQAVTVGFPYHPTPLGHEEMAPLRSVPFRARCNSQRATTNFTPCAMFLGGLGHETTNDPGR